MSKPLVGAPIGVNVDDTSTGTTTNGQNAKHQLGTVVNGIDGSRYVYVQAGAAVMPSTKAPNALAIDEDFQAVLMTSALGAAGHQLGFAPQVVIADNDFFWAKIAGVFNVRVAASTAADAYLRTSLVAGRLSATSTASAVAFPVVLATAASASTSAGNSVREAIAVGSIPAIRVGLASLP